MVADYFGTKHGPSLFGIIFFTGSLGGGLLPLIGGYLADITGNYYATLIFLGFHYLNYMSNQHHYNIHTD